MHPTGGVAASETEWDPWQPIPERYNLGEALTGGNVRGGRGDKPALLWENADGARRSVTYGELDRLSTNLARSLQHLGLQPGDRVFLRLPNLPEFYVAALAVAKAGGIFIPSSTQFRAPEVEYRLRDSGAFAAIVTTDLLAAVEEVADRCPDLKRIIVIPYPETDLPVPAYENFHQLCREDFAPHHSAGEWKPVDTHSSDPAFLAYTSGTTGDPKGVVHRHRYPLSYDSLIRYWHDYRERDIVACPSELGWLLPVASTFLYSLRRGVTIVLYDAMARRFDPAVWFGLFDRYRITNFTAPPTVYRILMAAAADEAAEEFDLSRWRHAASAGEPLPADTFHAIRRTFGVTPLDGIGMSECMVYCFNRIDRPVHPGSCGRPGPGTVIELLDEDLQPVPPGSEGILCVRRDSHPGMMKEYWRKPELTAEIFRGEWYVSGDVVRTDDDGNFWFRGRADDVIKASGYRISPFEVESCLCCHPAVLEAAAVECPDATRGMVVKAFVVLRAGIEANDPLATEIREFVRSRIAPYKCPRELEFIESLPKTTSGKTRRRQLREQERRAASRDEDPMVGAAADPVVAGPTS